MRRPLVAAAALALLAAGLGCGDDDGLKLTPVDLAVAKEAPPDLAAPGLDDGGDGAEVAVGPGGENAFAPQTVFVPAGGSVTWRWVSGVHSVVSNDSPPGFPSSPEQAGGDFTAHFSHAGQFGYHCGVPGHDETGVVIVQ